MRGERLWRQPESAKERFVQSCRGVAVRNQPDVGIAGHADREERRPNPSPILPVTRLVAREVV